MGRFTHASTSLDFTSGCYSTLAWQLDMHSAEKYCIWGGFVWYESSHMKIIPWRIAVVKWWPFMNQPSLRWAHQWCFYEYMPSKQSQNSCKRCISLENHAHPVLLNYSYYCCLNSSRVFHATSKLALLLSCISYLRRLESEVVRCGMNILKGCVFT